MASFIALPGWLASCRTFLLAGNEVANLIHDCGVEVRVDWQAEHLLRHVCGYREVGCVRRRQASIHREVRDQWVEVPARMNADRFQRVVESIPANREGLFDQNREIGIVGCLLAHPVQASDSLDAGQFVPIRSIDEASFFDRGTDVAQLEQAECSVEFAHFAVDSGGNDGDFPDVTKVFELVDPDFCFLVGADNRSAFESVEDFGSVETEYR